MQVPFSPSLSGTLYVGAIFKVVSLHFMAAFGMFWRFLQLSTVAKVNTAVKGGSC